MVRRISHMGIPFVRFPFLVVMLLCALVAPIAAMDIVLCIGADGHVTLEAGRNGRCGIPVFPSASSQRQTHEMRSSADHCGPCMDVSLVTGDTRAHLVSLVSAPAQADGLVLAFVTSGVAAFADATPTPFLISSPPVVSPILTALRTVVLLI
jgi:hypothetical protein